MINIKQICLGFADKVIFDNLSYFIPEKRRVGIVGDNGVGKTTLLRVLKGEQYLDGGEIELPSNRSMAFLDQESTDLPDENIISFIKSRLNITALEKELKLAEENLSGCDPESREYETALEKYTEVTHRFEHIEGYSFDSRTKRVLNGLGFKESDFSRNCTEFSGGWKIRISLALVLLSNADIMLLDEPTNHLDTESMEWLENYLKNYEGTIVTVSHDRRFLDKIVTEIVEISFGEADTYKGNYSYYLKEKERRADDLLKQLKDQEREIKQLEDFIERFRYKASHAKQAQSKIKQLAKIERVKLFKNSKTVSIHFPEYIKSGNDVLKVKNLSKAYDDNTVLNSIGFEVNRGERIALVGKNGAGKSTLSRLISKTEDFDGGEITYGVNVKSAYFSQESTENLDLSSTVWEEILAVDSHFIETERRNMLGSFLFTGNDIYKKVSVLSGGEKSRLALLKILLEKSNLLILDEPTNHLDNKTKDLFQKALLDYSGTIVIVSHDRYFLDDLIGRVLEIKNSSVTDYPGNYSYFIEKRASLEEKKDTPSSVSPEVKSVNNKEQRRIAAQKRQQISKVKKDQEKLIADLESKISSYEDRKTEIEELLCDADTLKNSEKVVALNKELNKISSDLTDVYEEWEEASFRLEEILESVN